MSVKVVYNDCYGGFSLSFAAVEWLAENARMEIREYAKRNLKDTVSPSFPYYCFHPSLERHDPDLVRCVETLGRKANGCFAELKVKELKGNEYRIDEYDGYEEVIEPEDEEYITVE